VVNEVGVRRAVVVGAVVVALSVAWFEATYESDDGVWVSFAVHLGPSVALLVAIILLMIVQFRRWSASVAFVVDAGNHVFRTRLAATALWWPAVLTVALTAIFWSFAPTTWEPGSDPEWQVGVVEVAMTAFLGLASAAVMGVSLYGLWSGRPSVELNRDGVRVRAPFGYLAVPWDGLRPGYPLRPSGWTGTLSLTVAQPNLARRRGIAVIPFYFLDIHPWFLADAIRYYVAHPEHRAAIGTDDEHDRLRHLLSGTDPRVVQH
jgi:hypothetical protein